MKLHRQILKIIAFSVFLGVLWSLGNGLIETGSLNFDFRSAIAGSIVLFAIGCLFLVYAVVATLVVKRKLKRQEEMYEQRDRN